MVRKEHLDFIKSKQGIDLINKMEIMIKDQLDYKTNKIFIEKIKGYGDYFTIEFKF